MNGVIGKSLLLCGVATVVYAITPVLAWYGLMAAAAGVLFLFEFYRESVSRQGLRAFVPRWVDDYLTREDMLDELVCWIRDNGTISKIARLMLIKFLDLSKDELVEVISGVWPEYRVLSRGGNHTVSLMELTPYWFRDMYLPSRKMLTFPSNGIILPPSDSINPIAEYAPLSPRTQASTSNMFPLLLWLAEKRIRSTMDIGAPAAGRIFSKSIGVSAILYLVWRKYPRSRKSIKTAMLVILALYLYSITRGLPGFTEGIFKFLNFSCYQTRSSQKRRREERRTHVPTGSFEKVVFALLEPLIPTVNVTEVQRDNNAMVSKPPFLHPSSPSWSQASTLEPMNE